MKIPRPKKQTYWVILSHETGNLFVMGYDSKGPLPYCYEGSHGINLSNSDFEWDVLWAWVGQGSLECLGKL